MTINLNIYKQLKEKKMFKKYTMQLCKWNATCKSEAQCVQCPNNSCIKKQTHY
jgi:hypothetical protein